LAENAGVKDNGNNHQWSPNLNNHKMQLILTRGKIADIAAIVRAK